VHTNNYLKIKEKMGMARGLLAAIAAGRGGETVRAHLSRSKITQASRAITRLKPGMKFALG
jgi:hypothetical protein